MNARNGWDSVKGFFERIGRRNLIIAGAVVLIGAAVAVDWVFFSGGDKGDGDEYDASAGMSTDCCTTLTTTANRLDATEISALPNRWERGLAKAEATIMPPIITSDEAVWPAALP